MLRTDLGTNHEIHKLRSLKSFFAFDLSFNVIFHEGNWTPAVLNEGVAFRFRKMVMCTAGARQEITILLSVLQRSCGGPAHHQACNSDGPCTAFMSYLSLGDAKQA